MEREAEFIFQVEGTLSGQNRSGFPIGEIRTEPRAHVNGLAHSVRDNISPKCVEFDVAQMSRMCPSGN